MSHEMIIAVGVIFWMITPITVIIIVTMLRSYLTRNQPARSPKPRITPRGRPLGSPPAPIHSLGRPAPPPFRPTPPPAPPAPWRIGPRCSTCNARWRENAIYCHTCGKAMDKESQNQAELQKIMDSVIGRDYGTH